MENPTIVWSVEHVTERVCESTGAVKLSLENLNDAGKIWMQHEYECAPNTGYTVTISYKFATADAGDFNLFRILAGASPREITNVSGVYAIVRDDTGHHTGEEVYVWISIRLSPPSNRRQRSPAKEQ